MILKIVPLYTYYILPLATSQLFNSIMCFDRERRVELFAKWRAKGGVFLIGYTAFRNLSLGKNMKDRHMAREICYALQVTVIDILNSILQHWF